MVRTIRFQRPVTPPKGPRGRKTKACYHCQQPWCTCDTCKQTMWQIRSAGSGHGVRHHLDRVKARHQWATMGQRALCDFRGLHSPWTMDEDMIKSRTAHNRETCRRIWPPTGSIEALREHFSEGWSGLGQIAVSAEDHDSALRSTESCGCGSSSTRSHLKKLLPTAGHRRRASQGVQMLAGQQNVVTSAGDPPPATAGRCSGGPCARARRPRADSRNR